MAAGAKTKIADRNDLSEMARVVNGRLLVSSTGGGGGTGDVNIVQVGGVGVGGSSVPVNDGGGSLTVDGAVGATVVGGDLDVTVTENDAAVADPDLIPIGATRDDALSTLSEAEGDWARLRVDANGALWVRNGDVTLQVFSGSTGGEPIQMTGTATASSVNIHTVPSGELHRIYMLVHNTSTSGQELTLEFGATGTAKRIVVFVPPRDTVAALNGVLLQGAKSITGFSSTANTLNVTGSVEKIN